jgi:predicted XRE-type DNA-binding protein
MSKKYKSIWDAIENTPSEAENMKLRSELMMAITVCVDEKGWTQTEAAAHLEVTQPRVSDLMRGKINLFALDALVNMIVAIGMHVEMKIRKAA